MYVNDGLDCCGMRELSSIRDNEDPKINVLITARENLHDMGGFSLVVFSDNSKSRYKYGQKLSAFIIKNKLGAVVETPRVRNPNTGRTICGWLWQVNVSALRKFYYANAPKHDENLSEWDECTCLDCNT